MKRKTLMKATAVLLVCTLALTVVYAGGEKEAVTEQKAAPGEPQYGGTHSMLVGRNNPTTWDITSLRAGPLNTNSTPYQEWLIRGDIDTYGPRGTGEWDCTGWEYIPDWAMIGSLAESWDFPNPETIIFTMREGIYWQADHVDFMESREFTAYDAAYAMNRRKTEYLAQNFHILDFVDTIAATDRYTVEVKMHQHSAAWAFWLAYGWGAGIYPPEVVEAGILDWRNHVGTGPFVITDHVPGSSTTFERNPNYWRTATIGGKQYQLPFIDKLIHPIIPDISTAVAALRTGELDQYVACAYDYHDTLARTSPDLVQKIYRAGQQDLLVFQTVTSEIGRNRNVRRALMIGTDLKSIGNSIYGGKYELHAWPISASNPDVHTPLEELPESAQELYAYDPEKARQMIADEGYPDGFEVELCTTTTLALYADIAALVKSQWESLNVDVTIKILESALFSATSKERTFKDMVTQRMGNIPPTLTLLEQGTQYGKNYAQYYDEHFETEYAKANSTVDSYERNKIFKELSIYFLEDVPYLPLPQFFMINAYWPWMQNYWGEVEGAYYNHMGYLSQMWIDQDLKKALGH